MSLLSNHTKIVPNGELTTIGMRQQYNLGKALKDRYMIKYQFLNPDYNSKEVYVRSSYVNRTIQSAQSQVYGIFEGHGKILPPNISDIFLNPPFNGESWVNKGKFGLPNRFPSIPIENAPNTEDLLIEGFYDCSMYAQEFERNIGSKIVNDTITLTMSTLKKIGQFMRKSDLPNFLEAFSFIDTLKSYLYLGKPFPKIFNDSDLENFDIISEIFMYSVLTGSKDQQTMINTHLFREILNHFNKTLNKKSNFKIALYSGHDVNVASTLNALNISQPDCRLNFTLKKEHSNCIIYPPFASQILFELLEDNSEFFVRVLFDGEEKLKFPYIEFIKLLQDLIPDDVEFNKICKGNS